MRRTRRMLVVTQLALALTLIAGAGLLLRSVGRLTDADHLGFSPEGVVAMDVRPLLQSSKERGAMKRLTTQLVARIREMPGVIDVAIGAPPLVGGSGEQGYREGFDAIFTYRRDGEDRTKTHTIWAKYVDDRYDETFGLRLRAGRSFTRADDSTSQKVVMINAAAARVFFGDEPPVGRYLPPTSLTDGKPQVALVVGVIGDALQNDITQEAKPEVLLPELQRRGAPPFINLAVKSSLPSPFMVGTLERLLREIDPTLAPTRLQAMTDVVDASLARHRFVLRLLMLFAALGLVLSMLGLYAVVSYLVAQRSGEIGVRMALGAQRRQIIALVLREGLLLASLGVLIGVPLALATSRLLGSLLYEIRAWDLPAFGAATVMLAGVALLAAYAPARKAAALDPAATLRTD